MSESTPNLWASVDWSGRSRRLRVTINKDIRPGRHPITVTATDGSSSTSETINFIVISTPKVKIEAGRSISHGYIKSVTASCGRTTVEEIPLQVSPPSAELYASSTPGALSAEISGSERSRTLKVKINKDTKPGHYRVQVEHRLISEPLTQIRITVTSRPRFEIGQEGRWPWRRSYVYATRDFISGSGDLVRRGAKGGVVKVRKNLNSSGCSWIADSAVVEAEGARVRISGNAFVGGRAKLNGSAKVSGNATVKVNAKVYGDAEVSGDATVEGNAKVHGTAEVSVKEKYDSLDNQLDRRLWCGNSPKGKVTIRGNAEVYGKAEVYGNATVEGNAKVYGSAVVCRNAKLSGDIKVKSGVFNGQDEFRRLAVYIYYGSYERISSIFQTGCGYSDHESRSYARSVLGVPDRSHLQNQDYDSLKICVGYETLRNFLDEVTPSSWAFAVELAFGFGVFSSLLRLANLPLYIHTAVSGMKDMLDLYEAAGALKDVRTEMEANRAASQGVENYVPEQFFGVEQHSFDVLERCIRLDKTRAECLKLRSVSCSKLDMLREECLELQRVNRR